jgi:pimeloyl-ACP methyl ester carboxylesterase
MVPLRIAGGALETAVLGSGNPVVLVPTALTGDKLLPLAERLRSRFRVIHYHRRGYGGSSPATAPGSVAQDSADCAALLEALGVHRAHVVGASYSAAVALQPAVDHPAVVHTLTALHVAGSDHGSLFADVGDQIRAWLPHATQVVVPGAGTMSR